MNSAERRKNCTRVEAQDLPRTRGVVIQASGHRGELWFCSAFPAASGDIAQEGTESKPMVREER